MPTTQTFSETAKLTITTETINEAGEIHITGKWNDVEFDQTLPIRPEGAVLLCFDEESYNFYWQRLVPEDARSNYKVVRTYGS